MRLSPSAASEAGVGRDETHTFFVFDGRTQSLGGVKSGGAFVHMLFARPLVLPEQLERSCKPWLESSIEQKGNRPCSERLARGNHRQASVALRRRVCGKECMKSWSWGTMLRPFCIFLRAAISICASGYYRPAPLFGFSIQPASPPAAQSASSSRPQGGLKGELAPLLQLPITTANGPPIQRAPTRRRRVGSMHLCSGARACVVGGTLFKKK